MKKPKSASSPRAKRACPRRPDNTHHRVAVASINPNRHVLTARAAQQHRPVIGLPFQTPNSLPRHTWLFLFLARPLGNSSHLAVTPPLDNVLAVQPPAGACLKLYGLPHPSRR